MTKVVALTVQQQNLPCQHDPTYIKNHEIEHMTMRDKTSENKTRIDTNYEKITINRRLIFLILGGSGAIGIMAWIAIKLIGG